MSKKRNIRFAFITTYDCNMYAECTYCYAKEASEKFGSMNITDFENVLKWLKEDYKRVEPVLIGGNQLFIKILKKC